MPPSLADRRSDPAAWARRLGISREAIDLYLDSDVIDLHLDTFIWSRVFGYDLRRRHGRGVFGARFYGMVDLPRALEAGMTGATWVITTNPLRTAAGRAATFFKNLERLLALFSTVEDHAEVVTNVREYRQARALGKHAAFLGVQGGNALDHDLNDFDRIPGQVILRITLVHLSSSRIGETSSPLRVGADLGLTPFGREYIERLNEKRIFVDLAHISRKGFFDALEVHDPSQPLLVTHTGIAGVYPHWRNVDDEQLRAVAETGGTVGVMYQASFLADPFSTITADTIVTHLEHIVKTVGDDHASLGSDWDGAIVPPRDVATCLELPRIVQRMLDRKWPADRVRKVLGANFLRVVEALRG